MKYLVITDRDASIIAEALSGIDDPDVHRIRQRLAADTGADIQEIVDQLKGMETCAACSIEGQERYCIAPHAQKLGRRLRRLLERARGEREPGAKERT